METIELGLTTYSDNVVEHCDRFDRLNTEFELHAPSADECERLCKPLVEGLIKKGENRSKSAFYQVLRRTNVHKIGIIITETASVSC